MLMYSYLTAQLNLRNDLGTALFVLIQETLSVKKGARNVAVWQELAEAARAGRAQLCLAPFRGSRKSEVPLGPPNAPSGKKTYCREKQNRVWKGVFGNPKRHFFIAHRMVLRHLLTMGVGSKRTDCVLLTWSAPYQSAGGSHQFPQQAIGDADLKTHRCVVWREET